MLSNEAGGIKRSREKFQATVIEQSSGTAVIHCRGRICFREEARRFSQAALEQLRARRNLALDFSDVAAIDSAGIGELVLVHMQARACECAIRIVNPPRQVQSLMELTNVISLFEVFPDVESALASLSAEVA